MLILHMCLTTSKYPTHKHANISTWLICTTINSSGSHGTHAAGSLAIIFTGINDLVCMLSWAEKYFNVGQTVALTEIQVLLKVSPLPKIRAVFCFGDLNFRIADHGLHFLRSSINSGRLNLLWTKDQVRDRKWWHICLLCKLQWLTHCIVMGLATFLPIFYLKPPRGATTHAHHCIIF